MSDHAGPSTSFGAISAGNAFAGNNFSGPATFAFHGPQDQVRCHTPAVCHSIPFQRNEDFVVRRELADKLDQLLPGTSSYQAAVLWGLGGSGKTQVALNYAYSRKDRDHHCSIFWVHADSESSFTQDYNSIARKLRLQSHLGGKDLLQAVCDQLESNPNWVLVIDNADDLTWFGVTPQGLGSSPKAGINLTDFIPKCSIGTGTVLWTSRDRQICSLVGAKQAINIVKMTTDEAKKLLNRSEKITEDEYDAAVELLDELDHLPLAISQVAAYMQKTSASIGNCLSDIRTTKETRWKVLRKSEHDRHRRKQACHNVLETGDISVEYLRNENELTYDVLHTLAFINNQNIPFELIYKAALQANRHNRRSANSRNTREKDQRKKAKKARLSNEDIEAIVTRLCDFSFLAARTSGPAVYDMHKLIQEAARYRLHKGRDEVKSESYFAKAAFEIVERLFPHPEGDLLKRELWERCEQYLAHALQTATWAELHEGEVQIAHLLQEVSDYLYYRCRWREKEVVDKKRLHFLHKNLRDRHPDTLKAMSDLAAAYYRQGKLKESEELLRKTLRSTEEVRGGNHPDTLSARETLAWVVGQQGNWAEVEDEHRQILGLKKKVLSEKDPRTLYSIYFLACTLLQQRKYEEAENGFLQILQLRTERLGEKHPETLDALEKLGIAIEHQGKYEKAKEIFLQVLQLRAEILGEKHPDTLDTLEKLGVAIERQGKYEKAEEIFRQALQLRTEGQGPKHPRTLNLIRNLGAAIGRQGRHGEAESIFRQVLQLSNEVLGPEHPSTLGSTRDLAIAIGRQGRHDEAKKIHQEALEKKEKMCGGPRQGGVLDWVVGRPRKDAKAEDLAGDSETGESSDGEDEMSSDDQSRA
ncbi:hypothetical protein F4803DRAFT_523870 [Xylaria telfairii]|nr:hypothetical protein F4803DRAFT_523870 [Xylaria telfairii]